MPFINIRTAAAIAAVVSAGAPTDITDTSANVPWTSDQTGDGFYLVDQNVTRTSAQVQAGTAVAVTSTGAQAPIALTGLTPEVTYYAHFVVVVGGVSSAVSTSALTTAAVPIIGEAFYDQTFMQMSFDTDLTDDSALPQTFTAIGGASVSGGELVLNGTTSAILSDMRPSDTLFFTGGSPWMVEWESDRPTGNDNTLVNTNDGASLNRGLTIIERDTGALLVLITNAVNGQTIMFHEFPAGSIPAGVNHKVIECDFGPNLDHVGVIHLGVAGNRVASGDRNSNRLASVDAQHQALEIGRRSNNVGNYNGALKRIRGVHSNPYDLANNATYTVPADPWFNQQQPGFHMFSAQHYPANDIDDLLPGFAYNAHAKFIPLGTGGHAISVMSAGASRGANSTTQIAISKSESYARKWEPFTSFKTDATNSVREPIGGRDSNGRIYIGYNYVSAADNQVGAGIQYSDDDGGVWSTEIDLTTAFSASMQAENWRVTGIEETSQGMMVVAGSNGRCEVVHLTLGGVPTVSTPVSVYSGQTGLVQPIPTRTDTTAKVVIVAREEGNGNTAFHSHKSSDGGLVWASSGSANWVGSANSASAPLALQYLSTGDVMMTWVKRQAGDGNKQCLYTVTPAAEFFTDPPEAWDALGSATQVTYHTCWGLAAFDEYGGPSIWDCGNGNVVAGHNEGVSTATARTRVFAIPLQV